MITEDYVSFETAKLLKEKGFEGKCHNSTQETTTHYSDEWNCSFTETTDIPTLQMAMKWLRKEHNLFIFPFPQRNTNKFWTEIFQLSDNQEWENLYCESIDLQDYQTYEETCEEAIKYCLKNLI